MYLFKHASALQKFLRAKNKESLSVGFVPTMGALHEGHLSLLRSARRDNDLTVCSIFVNPTQFNQASDLEKYPRTPGRDIEMLTLDGCDVLFLPAVEEIYPPGLATTIDLDTGHLDKVMEGEFRPGHFKGVMQVVKRLLDIISPDNLYLGQKDFQQYTILRFMVEKLELPVKVTMVPTMREPDGLAMSSRNVRLQPEMRARAPIIFQTLSMARDMIGRFPPDEICRRAIAQLSIPGFEPEYFSIVDGHTLETIRSSEKQAFIVACTAVWAGDVRLIDNIVIRDE